MVLREGIQWCSGWGTMLQAGRSRIREPMSEWIVLIFLILLVSLCPGGHSASNRNEYQKQKNHASGEWSVAGA
jgi:hypothetical protein